MRRRRLTPVSIEGITFDAMLDEQKNLKATIPTYPVEEGFPVSDTIILDPIGISMTLYVSNTPVTFLYRHSNSMDRVKKICDQIENLWLSRKLVKIVTSDTIYTDMGLTSISIKKSKDLGYAREISITASKIRVTSRKTASIPDYILKSGETMANAGKANSATSSQSSKSTVAPSSTEGSGGESVNSGGESVNSGGKTGKSGGSSSRQKEESKKGHSILYGIAGKAFGK
nr:MAG TPA: hypothetical protein [Caudoviricetes sp.]